jgi:hypothetical protein
MGSMTRCLAGVLALLALGAAAEQSRPAPYLPLASLRENFDGVTSPALPAGWTSTVVPPGSAIDWQTQAFTADTPPNMVIALPPGIQSDRYLDSPAFVVNGPLPRVRFRHRNTLSTNEDGAVLEISINGAAYVDILAAGGSFVLGPYNNTLANASSPLNGRQVWSNLPSGYQTTVALLPAAAIGQSVRLRFRLAQLSGGITFRWLVDSVSVVRGSQLVDFDGNAISDWTVLRQVDGVWHWYTLNSTGFSDVVWGLASGADVVFSADYDGDGRSDPVQVTVDPRTFYVRLSSTGALLARPFGLPLDVASIPADYDGDGKTDVAVWRGPTGVWWIARSSDAAVIGQQFGQTFDHPAVADYDGDLVPDLAVRRAAGGVSQFYILRSSDGGFEAVQWGRDTDGIVPGDYDGDGRTDIAVVREEGGVLTFYVRKSSDAGLMGQIWGLQNDFPTPGDYDGDGRTDFAVWRRGASEGTFYVLRSTNGALVAQPWGLVTDYPLALFIRRP